MPTKAPLIRLTKHAERKLQQRGIRIEEVIEVVANPAMTRNDAIDPELVHYIAGYRDSNLRVIGKWVPKKTFVVVTAFIDRRIQQKDRI